MIKLLSVINRDFGLYIISSIRDIDIVPRNCNYTYVIDRGKIILEGTR